MNKSDRQTVISTATLLKETEIHLGEKDKVTSPEGMTIAGIAELESKRFRSALIKAVKTATERSRDYSKY